MNRPRAAMPPMSARGQKRISHANYEAAEGLMAEAIEDGLSHLSGDDLKAIAQYIKSLPPIGNNVPR